jgi:hypothetical protein
MLGGWLDWEEVGVAPGEIADRYRAQWQSTGMLVAGEFLSSRESWSWVQAQRVSVNRLSSFNLFQLRWLRQLECLDLIDRDELVKQIVSVQVRSGETPPGGPRIHGWRTVHGLFFTPGWPALEDTYYAVAALEILGGLDQMDREACIRGILRVHAGRGFFVSPDSGGYNEYKIRGDARDTLAAYETLRILGALDRVKDLPQWKFRPSRVGVAEGQFSWQDVEAWVCQERLEQGLREVAANPDTPFGSLLKP